MLEQIKLAFGLDSLELRDERRFEWSRDGKRFTYVAPLIEKRVDLYLDRRHRHFWKTTFRPDWRAMMPGVLSAIRQTI